MVVDVQDNISPPKSVKSPVPTADPSTPRVEATPPVEETTDAASEGHRTRSRSPSKSATSARSEKKNQRKRPAESSPPPTEPPVATGASGVASQSVAGDVTPRTTRSRRSSPAPRPASTLVPKAVDVAAEDASDVDVSAVRQSRARKRTRVDQVTINYIRPRKFVRAYSVSGQQVDDDCASDAGSFAPEDHFRYATPEREPNLSMVADVAEEVAADNEEDVARAQRSWRASVMQLWHQIAENKNANLFRHPVDPKKVEGCVTALNYPALVIPLLPLPSILTELAVRRRYGEVILKPMDLGTIKKYIELGIIVSARDMEYHLMLMSGLSNPYLLPCDSIRSLIMLSSGTPTPSCLTQAESLSTTRRSRCVPTPLRNLKTSDKSLHPAQRIPRGGVKIGGKNLKKGLRDRSAFVKVGMLERFGLNIFHLPQLVFGGVPWAKVVESY